MTNYIITGRATGAPPTGIPEDVLQIDQSQSVGGTITATLSGPDQTTAINAGIISQ